VGVSLSAEAIQMADISEFSIVTYERKPDCWRAAITRKGSAGMVVGIRAPDSSKRQVEVPFEPFRRGARQERYRPKW
jgi:hypothetical protein